MWLAIPAEGDGDYVRHTYGSNPARQTADAAGVCQATLNACQN
jgi:hypothetical protein